MDELSGRTFLVTGGNTGIGLATAKALAARGGRVHLACRSEQKGRAAETEIAAAGGGQVSFLQLDLADLGSVRASAQAFLTLGEPLHVLINNAGIAGRRGLTRDGFELMFGVNHLGHFAFTMALLDCLTSSRARVVTVASDAHYAAKGVDFSALRRPARGITGMAEYSVHPGLVASAIWRRVPWPVRPLITRRMLTVAQGARTSLYCATAPELAAVSGRYYENCAEREPSQVATAELAGRLWEQSVAWTG